MAHLVQDFWNFVHVLYTKSSSYNVKFSRCILAPNTCVNLRHVDRNFPGGLCILPPDLQKKKSSGQNQSVFMAGVVPKR
jgi:hypothetical protein